MKGMVSITFDDGYLNQYENAFSIMQKFGFVGTIFVITEKVDKSSITISYRDATSSKPVTLKQLKEMNRAGWEIGSHTAHHPPLALWKDYDALEVKREVTSSRNWLWKNEFEPFSFSYPFGYWSKLIEEIVKRDFSCARTTYPGFNEKPSFQMKAMISHDSKDFRFWLREAKESKRWLITVFHGVEKELQPHSGWCTNKYLENFLTHLKISKLPVKTIAEVSHAF